MSAGKIISRLRADLVRYPKNSIMWVDLALAYANIGQTQKAQRCMSAALTLDPNNRFILRSATRFHLHSDKAFAHFILRKSPATPADPWLIAAELSVASLVGRSSDFVKDARNALSSGKHSMHDLAELASQLATINLRDGRVKEAHRLFALSLSDPTDNSLAQVHWAAEKDKSMNVPGGDLGTPLAFEVRAFDNFIAGKFRPALDEAKKWIGDEPYSSRAAIFGSYIAGGLLYDYDASISLAGSGLKAKPNNNHLLNNLAFAYAQRGEIAEALRWFRRIPIAKLEPDELIPKIATGGLIEFRRGNLTEGRLLYEKAIRMAHSLRLENLEQMALIHLGFEEIRAKTEDARSFAVRALEQSRSASKADVIFLRERLREQTEALIS